MAKWVGVLKEKYAGMKLIVARDKLDYIKGVRQKMLAFERFLNLYPEYQGKVKKQSIAQHQREIFTRLVVPTASWKGLGSGERKKKEQ